MTGEQKPDTGRMEVVEDLVENLDVMTNLAKYMSEVINQISRALAVICLDSRKSQAPAGDAQGCLSTMRCGSLYPYVGWEYDCLTRAGREQEAQ